MITATLTPDRLHWDVEVNSRFDRFERRLYRGLPNRIPEIKRMVVPVVEQRRVRPKDKTSPRTPLASAIEQSIAPARGIGIGIGDRNVLQTLAPHWHAIEVGSHHIVGMQLWGFSGPGGVFLPTGSRFRKDSRRATLTEMRAGGLNPAKRIKVKNPIRPHKYLETLGIRTRVVVHDELQKRATEAFGGANYKTQTRNAGA